MFTRVVDTSTWGIYNTRFATISLQCKSEPTQVLGITGLVVVVIVVAFNARVLSVNRFQKIYSFLLITQIFCKIFPSLLTEKTKENIGRISHMQNKV